MKQGLLFYGKYMSHESTIPSLNNQEKRATNLSTMWFDLVSGQQIGKTVW
jgi:hypothetical protein